MLTYIITCGLIIGIVSFLAEIRVAKSDKRYNKVATDFNELLRESKKVVNEYKDLHEKHEIACKILMDIYTKKELNELYDSERAKRDDQAEAFKLALQEIISNKERKYNDEKRNDG